MTMICILCAKGNQLFPGFSVVNRLFISVCLSALIRLYIWQNVYLYLYLSVCLSVCYTCKKVDQSLYNGVKGCLILKFWKSLSVFRFLCGAADSSLSQHYLLKFSGLHNGFFLLGASGIGRLMLLQIINLLQ